MLMKRLLLLSCFFSLGMVAFAIPAKKGTKKPIKLKDGTFVLAELKGDEFKSYWQGENGDCYIADPDAHSFRNIELKEFSPFSEKGRDIIAKARTRRRQKISTSRASLGNPDHIPYLGKKKGLIILAEFKNKKFKTSHNLEYYQNLANQTGFTTPYGHVGSVKDYFLAQSNGQFELDFDVVGPVKLPNDYAYYGAHTKDGSNDSKPGTMVAQACMQASEKFGVNFADYDWDGDGEVDQVFILYAGQGEAAGGDEDTVWPHEYQLQYTEWGSQLTFGDVKVDTYACGSEQSVTIIRNNFTGTYQLKEFPDGIGTICHEFSHCLGFADMYDVNYGGNYGMGSWDIMDTGSYNGNGRGYSPANYTAYERFYAGWLEPYVLDKPTTVKGMRPSGQYGQTFIIYNEANKNEYYLLENRQQQDKWDQALPGSGLMITHVDFDPIIWEMNHVNTNVNYSATYGEEYAKYDNDHQRCTIFHADNSIKDDERTDLYPANGNNSLTDTSEPFAMVYNAKADGSKLMGKPITNIVQNADGTIDFDFMGGSTKNIISGIHDILMPSATTTASKKIFTLDGRYAGENLNVLGCGVYIINGKKVVK